MSFHKGHENSTVAFSKDEVELIREAIGREKFRITQCLIGMKMNEKKNHIQKAALSHKKSSLQKQFLMLESARDKIDATHPTLKEKL